MFKALIVKELREAAGIVALATIGVAYALAELTATPLLPWQSSRLYQYPFVSDSLSFYFALTAGGLAIALGLKQTAWELGQGTAYFLLHRPISRARIFGYKLWIGAALVLLIGGLFILFYAWWAATPGSFAAPFFWSMTDFAWRMWIAILPVYFGAFLSGIRPGRWFGSRLLPLLAGCLLAIVAANMFWFWLSASISLITSAMLVIGIFFYVQERDY